MDPDHRVIKREDCMWMCVYTADIYESRSDSFHDIYHEINVKNHSSANSLQVPYFLIRRAAKKWRL